MFKWTVQAEIITKASPLEVWNIWTDVSSWPTWDEDLEWSSLNGPFKVGTEGKLKPKGWPVSKFRLIAVKKYKSHSEKTAMPLTKIIFSHSLIPDNKNVKIIHRVEASGLLAPLLWLTMRKALKKGMPQALKKLAQLAELKAKASLH